MIQNCDLNNNINSLYYTKGFEDGKKWQKENLCGDDSDGYHTFNELYDFRRLYNALIFNEWYKNGLYDVHKSYKHHDNELCFGGGWFIVMATTPFGQISNHYENKFWDNFICDEREIANKWDGHTAVDVVNRINLILKQ